MAGAFFDYVPFLMSSGWGLAAARQAVKVWGR